MEIIRPMLAFLQRTQARKQRKKIPVKIQRPQGDDDSNGQRNTRHREQQQKKQQQKQQQSRLDPFSAFSDPLTVVGVVKDDDE